MGLERQYLDAVMEACLSEHGVSELSPSVLATAAVTVLPVEGASISMIQPKLRVPLAWSSPDAEIAERHQTTLGDGPCLTAVRRAEPVLADADAVVRCWPLYYAEIERRTPFRSVVALPLGVGDAAPFAALDLHSERHDLSAVLDLDDATSVAIVVARLLTGLLDSLYTGDGRTLPSWFDDDVASDRVAVWSAVGMLLAHSGLDDVGALARLRAYAYSHDLDLDETAAQLLDRDIDVEDVLT